MSTSRASRQRAVMEVQVAAEAAWAPVVPSSCKTARWMSRTAPSRVIKQSAEKGQPARGAAVVAAWEATAATAQTQGEGAAAREATAATRNRTRPLKHSF